MDMSMLIGSKFEKGTETEEPIFNPRTGETVLQMPEASLAQIRGVNAARTSAVAFHSTRTRCRSTS